MATDRQALAALEEIDQILKSRIARRHDAGDVGSPQTLVDEYVRIRVQLDTALTLIDKIPVYGRRIGTAVRFLIQLGDRVSTPELKLAMQSEANASRHHGDAVEVQATRPLLPIGQPVWAQPERRVTGLEGRAPSAEGSTGMIGVI